MSRFVLVGACSPIFSTPGARERPPPLQPPPAPFDYQYPAVVEKKAVSSKMRILFLVGLEGRCFSFFVLVCQEPVAAEAAAAAACRAVPWRARWKNISGTFSVRFLSGRFARKSGSEEFFWNIRCDCLVADCEKERVEPACSYLSPFPPSRRIAGGVALRREACER